MTARLDVGDALGEALSVLMPVRDVVLGRVADDAMPAWCEARGWTSFLLALGDEEAALCEREGLGACLGALPAAPPSLVALAHAVARVTTLPRLDAPQALARGFIDRVPARKRAQVAALLAAVSGMAARASRIVDVGAGRGHFTRIAADAFDTDTLGLERDAARVASAARLASASPRARFAAFDADREGLDLGAGDLAIGLHACGDLGDRLVVATATSGCDLGLVSCCFQKIAASERAPLSSIGRDARFTLPRETLGLANLTAREEGVEAAIEVNMEARRARFALASLLRARGVVEPPGEEMRGMNRRRARQGLAAIAGPALHLRGLAPATERELRAHDEDGTVRFGKVRRLALPRSMLARLVEVAVVLDRGAALVESGHTVTVASLCDAAVTPRNLAVLARMG